LIFCLQMIQIFKEEDCFEKIVLLMAHANEEVRSNASKTLACYTKRDAINYFKMPYTLDYIGNKGEKGKNRTLIVKDGPLLFLNEILFESNHELNPLNSCEVMVS
jgi:hypothetical protein